jgi:hypothetical protein
MLAEAAQTGTETTGVIAALRRAASETGADFSYLLSTAKRESSMKPQAESATSSATGLFQFVDQTWLGLVKNYGAKYGLGSMANAIERSGDGHYRADNAADRQAILALRKDPQISALMEGEYVNATRSEMKSSLGRDVCQGELYAAHFLGPEAACRLIETNAAQPNACAASVFPQAADANHSVFYHADGTAKTVAEVYHWATRQIVQGSSQSTGAAGDIAGAKATKVAYSFAPQNENAMVDSLTSWRPQHGFFGADSEDGGNPSTPLLLTPEIMDVLSNTSSLSVKPH